jgi:hypothetical protein
MTLISSLTLVHETQESAYYAENPAKEGSVLLGALTVQKWALPQPTPTALRLTLEAYETERPSPPVAAGAEKRHVVESDTLFREGALVVIVKNRLAGIHQPPEWLEQYLGRQGKILWTTAGGAMVQLDKQATWFPYAELEVKD